MDSDQPAVRLPANYRIVLDIIRGQGTGEHATANDIFSEAKRRKPEIGYSTVYRALDRLRALGLVSELRIPGANSMLYEPVRTSHAHFVCDGCGQVDDIEHSPSPSDFEQLARGRNIDITGISVTLHGRCAPCRTGRKDQA